MKIFQRLCAFILVILAAAPIAAQAADIPLLNWQRGRDQQIVIGEGSLNRSWKVTFEGNGIDPLQFKPSAKDTKGYIVFTVSLPADLPEGAYQVFTQLNGGERRLVAGINVVPAQAVTVTDNFFNLSAIIAIFALLTSISSTIRARKYAFISFYSGQVLPKNTDPIKLEEENFWDRLEQAPYRVRVNSLLSLRQSLLRFLFIREGELAHSLSKNLYGVLPLAGLVAGVVAGIETVKNDGIATTSLTIFVAVSLLAIFDALSGVFATLGLWASLLLTGNITSVRDLLIALSIGISWVGPALFASLLRELVQRDFESSSARMQSSIKVLGTIGSALIGSLVFYFGHALVNSIIYVDHPDRVVNSTHFLIIGIALLVRGIADGLILQSKKALATRDESITIARVGAPSTAFLVFLLSLAFIFIWTNSFPKAIAVAVAFSIPYFLLFIRFASFSWVSKIRIPRNIALEGLVVGAITFIVFRETSTAPLLSDKKATLFLALAAISPLIHALYSALRASGEAKFPNPENVEII